MRCKLKYFFLQIFVPQLVDYTFYTFTSNGYTNLLLGITSFYLHAYPIYEGARGSVVVEALSYKLEGRGIAFR
jgi:hypothetical protein